MKNIRYDFVLHSKERTLNLFIGLCEAEVANLCVAMHNFYRIKRYTADFENSRFLITRGLKDNELIEKIDFSDCDILRFAKLSYKAALCEYLEKIGD